MITRRLGGFLAVTLLMTTAMAAQDVSPQLSLYGYVKVDALYETGRSSHGNYAIWAADPGDSEGAFHLTANQTRLGLKVTVPEWRGFAITALVEADFYGGGAENKALPFMRHAYLQVRKKGFTLIAGQYWDIINPLNPYTLNYPVLWGAGNLGYRRPQLRLRQEISLGAHRLVMEGGIFRTIAGDLDGDGVDDGVAAGFPTFQGRVAGRFKLSDSTWLRVGVSGHYGRSRGDQDLQSRSLNLDFTLSLGSGLTVMGEWFSGRNLKAYLGGIVQDMNPGTGVEIRSRGFYVNIQVRPVRRWFFSAGYGRDDPDDDDLALGGRSRNAAWFAVLEWRMNPHLRAGLEVSAWKTGYRDQASEKTLRLQHAWILTF